MIYWDSPYCSGNKLNTFCLGALACTSKQKLPIPKAIDRGPQLFLAHQHLAPTVQAGQNWPAAHPMECHCYIPAFPAYQPWWLSNQEFQAGKWWALHVRFTQWQGARRAPEHDHTRIFQRLSKPDLAILQPANLGCPRPPGNCRRSDLYLIWRKSW